ncbi:MAG TPA: hypothetical protein EYP78_05665 [Candidatus Omnitrophica bacterium]|nr:hypothetical protein [Candidatus Omnitrophota bacterium]
MRWLINNWAFKILSLILSLVLWLYVSGELEQGLGRRTEEITFYDIPIGILSWHGEEFKVKIEPDKAKVIIEGDRGKIDGIVKEDIVLFVDLGNLQEESYYELPIQFKLPQGLSEYINVSKIIPHTVIATIEKKGF